MRILAWALLFGTFQAALNSNLGSQTPVREPSLAVLVPRERKDPQDEMLRVLVDSLRASGHFEHYSLIEFTKFDLRDRRASARRIESLRERTLASDVIVCIGSQALIPFLAVKSDLPDSVALYSLGVLGLAHTSKFSKHPPLPNVYRLRGASCSDIDLKMAVSFTEQIRVGAGPYGAILGRDIRDPSVVAAKALARSLGTRLEVERIDSPRQLEAAAAKLIRAGIHTFIKLPDPLGTANRNAAPVMSRIRLDMTRRGIAIMGLGPGDKDGAFGFTPDYAQATRDLASMILRDLAGSSEASGIRTATRVVPYVLSPKNLTLRPNWAKTLTMSDTH